MFPYEGSLFICDFSYPRPARRDAVYCAGPDSLRLAERRIPRRVGRALDLCTGSGIQAILAAGDCREVTAVDLSPRALSVAARNLALNEITNVKLVQGDLYGRLGDATFDLVLANPPFVASPDVRLAFRDGGPLGDRTLMPILEELPQRLNPGGICQVVTVLYELEGNSQLEALEAFAHDRELEVLVLSGPPGDRYDLARKQYRDTIRDHQRYRESVMAYLDHLDRIGLQSWFSCVISVRKGETGKFERRETIGRTVQFEVDDVVQQRSFFGMP